MCCLILWFEISMSCVHWLIIHVIWKHYEPIHCSHTDWSTHPHLIHTTYQLTILEESQTSFFYACSSTPKLGKAINWAEFQTRELVLKVSFYRLGREICLCIFRYGRYLLHTEVPHEKVSPKIQFPLSDSRNKSAIFLDLCLKMLPLISAFSHSKKHHRNLAPE